MNTIIAGRFTEQAQADMAVDALLATGFQRDQIAKFFCNPAGQHDLHGTPDDPEASAGAHHAGTGAGVGAATGLGVGTVVGLATIPVLGPGAALAGAAMGAYVGSLAGALEKMGDHGHPVGDSVASGPDGDEAPPRKAGVLVAVGAASSLEQVNAVTVLSAKGAADIETAQGSIAHSEWIDFDPLAAPVPATNA